MDTNTNKKIGRPLSDDPKINLANVRIKGSIIDTVIDIADRNNKTQSDIWEEAMIFYLQKYEEVKTLVVRL